MNPAEACASHGWSIITSASTNSQFAGVLAGFVFTGIVMLFAMRGGRYTQALAVLSPTFIVLGFDSYLFSHVTGSGNDGECARVWTDGMFASGMLGVGAAGVVSSICWLLAAHLDAHAEQLPPKNASTDETTQQSHKDAQAQTATDQRTQAAQRDPAIVNLPRIAAGMVYGVTVGISLLLAMTADRYLRLVLADAPSTVWIWAVWAVPVAVLVRIAVLVFARWRRRKSHPHAVESKTRNSRVRSLTFVVYGMLTYGLLTPVLAGVIASVSDHWWREPAPLIIVAAVFVELVLATLLLVALVLAAPPMPSATAMNQGEDGSPGGQNRDVPNQPGPATLVPHDRGGSAGKQSHDQLGRRAETETA
ncbi:hypothetical protein ABTX15_31300 [Micromonospora sp. NPDC094482]|uniref:hypothetical protein n=1 Tax=unclassified Micromonospora TaxID=2617518 RepID=UPI00332BF0AB